MFFSRLAGPFHGRASFKWNSTPKEFNNSNRFDPLCQQSFQEMGQGTTKNLTPRSHMRFYPVDPLGGQEYEDPQPPQDHSSSGRTKLGGRNGWPRSSRAIRSFAQSSSADGIQAQCPRLGCVPFYIAFLHTHIKGILTSKVRTDLPLKQLRPKIIRMWLWRGGVPRKQIKSLQVERQPLSLCRFKLSYTFI